MADGPVRITQPLLDVLEVLLEADGHELHGWAIMKTTKRSGPTIYKILERLAAAKWLSWRWEELSDDASGPRRRFYKLTPHGSTRARSLVAQRSSSSIGRKLRPAFDGFGA